MEHFLKQASKQASNAFTHKHDCRLGDFRRTGATVVQALSFPRAAWEREGNVAMLELTPPNARPQRTSAGGRVDAWELEESYNMIREICNETVTDTGC